MEPLISVIIPVYNVLPYLREALDSVISQTYKNLEIIIIDDGSTDGSEEVCDEYTSDSRVIVIHQENRGLSGARNTGLEIITGDYVAFLDSDDAYHPDMIRKMKQSLVQYEADIVACGYGIFQEKGRMTKKNQTGVRGYEKEMTITAYEALDMLMEGKYIIAVWNKLYPRRLWEHLRFPEGHVFEDLWVSPYFLEQCNRIVLIPDILVYYRERKNSITRTKTIHNIREHMYAYKAFLDYVEKKEFPLSSNSIELFREGTVHRWIQQWIDIYKQCDKQSLTGIDELRNEMLDFAGNNIHYTSMKHRVLWWLFKHHPRMLILLHTYFVKYKELIH